MYTYGLSFIAGLLTTLSPCVLPILPLVLAGATAKSPYGPLALVAGLVLTATSMALLLSGVGFLIGIDTAMLRLVGAAMLVLTGAVILLVPLQRLLARATGPLANWANVGATRRTGDSGVSGQFILGALTGVIWTPCIGPAVGAAAALVLQSQTALSGALQLALFSLGAGFPMMLLAYGARAGILRRRSTLSSAAAILRPLMGGLLIFMGGAALTGFDHRIENWLLMRMPASLLDLTTAI